MIRISHLSKNFNDLKAVDDISFNIKRGEIFGLLGPNGAGKTTTINMLSTLLKCTKGSIKIDNTNLIVYPEACKKIIGVVPQEIALYTNFSAYDNLFFWGRLYKIPTKILKQRIDEMLELIGLTERKNELIKNYSGGMKRRINIAAGLLHSPKILFMDEPTVGVDPQSRNRIFEIVETLNKHGVTIVYTSHYMEEIERLCNRIGIIDEGKIVAIGTKEELKKQCPIEEKISILFNATSENDLEQKVKELPFNIKLKQNLIEVACDINKDLTKIISFCNTNKLEIKDINLEKVNLENVFLSLTGKKLRD